MKTLSISKTSIYLKVFCWMWKTDIKKLNICKLFWGTLFFPFALFQRDSGNLVVGFLYVLYATHLIIVHMVGWGIFFLFISLYFFSMYFFMKKKILEIKEEKLTKWMKMSAKISGFFIFVVLIEF